jgi:ubiquinone/menaquinone biosynthesis C-methylase UbiE
MITNREIREYYERQGKFGNHQKEMYETGDSFTRYWQNKRRIIVEKFVEDLIEQGKANSLLDVGCAEGLYTRFLAHRREYSIGLDISRPKLIRAKSYCYHKNVQFILASAENLPFRDNSFDIVLCIDVLRCVKNLFKAVNELFRVSRKYIIIQSATNLRNFGRITPRDYSSIKEEFHTKPFAGAVWSISSAGLIRTLPQNIKILRVIGHPFVLTGLLLKIRYLRNSNITLKIAKYIDDFYLRKESFKLAWTFYNDSVKKGEILI